MERPAAIAGCVASSFGGLKEVKKRKRTASDKGLIMSLDRVVMAGQDREFPCYWETQGGANVHRCAQVIAA